MTIENNKVKFTAWDTAKLRNFKASSALEGINIDYNQVYKNLLINITKDTLTADEYNKTYNLIQLIELNFPDMVDENSPTQKT